MDDLCADFRVFYHITDLDELTGPMFFSLAMRVFAYGGVLTNRAAMEMQNNGKDKTVSSKAVMKMDPAFSDLIEWSG